MKRRRAEESADVLELMTSSVTSSYSADGLREQSQESADSAGRLCVDIQKSQDTSWKHMFYTSWTTRRKQQQLPVESLYEPAVAMNRVASFAYPVASSTHPVASFGSRRKKRRSSEAWKTDVRSSRSDEPAEKQLTIYEELSKLDVNC
ncbi:hypothetical protein F511_18441 [Dorcoceras hygrometricum]|uniref:Uncharacterized protein n=1 Tax=Dorcoceras hygrometricum TaxID=472368 RepID=A0A2Z7B4I1_9LAMI|nr:hypothetical protein F511_18441 [Dorcoceras hygrometricum]